MKAGESDAYLNIPDDAPEGFKAAYGEMLDGKHIKDDYFNAAVLSSIMTDLEITEDGVIGQKAFLSAIFERHEIVPYKGAHFIEDPNYALIDKEYILDQIKTKKEGLFSWRNKLRDGIAVADSMQMYKELDFLENYLGKKWETGDYLSKEKNKKLFTVANQYRLHYRREEAIIDALNQNTQQSGPKTIWEHLQDSSWLLSIFGVAMLFMKDYRKLGVWALAAGLFAKPVGDMIDGGMNKGKQALWMAGIEITDTELDLINPGEYAVQLWIPEYQDKFSTLFKQNIVNREHRFKTENGVRVQQPSLEPELLQQIVKDITSKWVDVSMHSTDIVWELVVALRGKDIKIDKEKNTAYSKSDLEQFVSLLQTSNIKESGDSTLLDYLSDGKDVANERISIAPTNESYFDGEINRILNEEYTKEEVTRDDRIQLSLFAEHMEKEFSKIREFWEDVKAGRVPKLDTISQDIDKIEQYMKDHGIENSELTHLLENFEKYAKAKATLAEYNGLFTRQENIEARLYRFFTDPDDTTPSRLELLNHSQLRELQFHLEGSINTLKKAKLTWDIATKDPYKQLNEDIEKYISQFEDIYEKNQIDLSGGWHASIWYSYDDLLELYNSDDTSIVDLEQIVIEASGKLQGYSISGVSLVDIWKDIEELKPSILRVNKINGFDDRTFDDSVWKTMRSSVATINSTADAWVERVTKITEEAQEKFTTYYNELNTIKKSVDSISVASDPDFSEIAQHIEALQKSRVYLDVTNSFNLGMFNITATAESNTSKQLTSGSVFGIQLESHINIDWKKQHERVDASYKKAKEVLWDDFSITDIDSPESLWEELQASYDAKKKEVEKAANKYVSSIDATKVDALEAISIMAHLGQISEAFSSNASLVTASNEKKLSLKDKYLSNKVSDDPALQEALEADKARIQRELDAAKVEQSSWNDASPGVDSRIEDLKNQLEQVERIQNELSSKGIQEIVWTFFRSKLESTKNYITSLWISEEDAWSASQDTPDILLPSNDPSEDEWNEGGNNPWESNPGQTQDIGSDSVGDWDSVEGAYSSELPSENGKRGSWRDKIQKGFKQTFQ